MVWSNSKGGPKIRRWLALSLPLTAVALCTLPAQAQTVTFPAANPDNLQFNTTSGRPRFFYQTSGPQRGINIGDWYTSNTGGGNTGSTGRIHTFIVDIPPEAFTAAQPTVTITINDGEANGANDEITATGGEIGLATCTLTGNSGTSNPTNPCADTSFVLSGAGVVGANTLTFAAGSLDGSSGSFTVNQPGTYVLTSQTAGNVDNGFSISVPATALPLIGQTQSAFQQNDIDGDRTQNGSRITANFFYITPPGTPSLFIRNFDLDQPDIFTGQTITYSTVSGGAAGAGTVSNGSVWNSGGSVNLGGDLLNGATPGIGQVTVGNFASDNQMILEVRGGNNETAPLLPVFDRRPTRAGNFTVTPNTTLVTTPGVSVDHPFTITNNFFASDGFNITLPAGDPNYTAVLIDPATNQPLTDNDSDGNPDIGITGTTIPGINPLTGQPFAGNAKQLILRVTPNANAPSTAIDTRNLTVTSFLDRRVAPGSFQTRAKQVTKITSIGGLGDTVYIDTNGNGIQDAGEVGLANVTLTLLDPGADNIPGNGDDPAPITTTTNAQGQYQFSALPNRNYQVVLTLPAGYASTTTQAGLGTGFTFGTQGTSPAIGGALGSGFDFGLRFSGSNQIGDQVFSDANGDGVAQAGETGIVGIQLSLTTPGPNGVFGDADDVQVATATSDAQGRYNFPSLPDGRYRVSVTGLPSGLRVTTPQFFDRTVAGGQTVTDADFGINGSVIGDQVFSDLNGNGVADAGESGIAGVTVTLFSLDANGNPTQVGQPVVTDANGRYSFSPSPGVNYRVVVTPPADATLTTPASRDGFLANGQIDLTRDFGIVPRPGFRLVKRITNVTRDGVSIPGFDFNAVIDDPTTTEDNAAGFAQIPLRGQVRVNGQTQIRSGDEITYTVYYLSDGTSPLFDAGLCDQIPENTSFVVNTNQIQQNNGAIRDGGTAYTPLAPLPAGNACVNQTNPTGSVLFNLGNVSNTTGSNFGLVRFRVRIN
jgi:uncharacterized repeat protein (TIGR01451 family)